ncbi:hypothetical protein [Flavobacterium rhizosphaerae]|uniref:Transposase n=1 Tax=Flavobacterium rhizosphaerae TaxID=3163298 RepID=A0ABW8YXB7_9FLAO
MKLPPVKFKNVTKDHTLALQEMAICLELYYELRKKIESGKLKFTFSIKIYQAITLLFACSYGYKEDGEFQSCVALIYQNDLDNQLKNMIKAIPKVEKEDPQQKVIS